MTMLRAIAVETKTRATRLAPRNTTLHRACTRAITEAGGLTQWAAQNRWRIDGHWPQRGRS